MLQVDCIKLGRSVVNKNIQGDKGHNCEQNGPLIQV